MEKIDIEKLAFEKFQIAGAIIPVPVVSIAKALNLTISEIVMPEVQGIVPSGILAKPDGNWVILINNKEVGTRKRFTIAHEIGHFLLHSALNDFVLDDFPTGETFYRGGIGDDKEKEANFFAACLLMPTEEVKTQWGSGTYKNPSEIAVKFNVSEVSMTYRLKELGLIQDG